ncbi:Carboxypeptidase C (cathepsin A) [Granulicella pectinivorans]|jgi:carboxypeptidase C (cathepsin A)|uniref:Carboxypeptidase C (Cathepsin A) n=1 Tax=Granulicella pectinivorans TaxID=474950 RepID=A0A1I6N1I5_9BACT|nr:peptidase S10 [Granulicella pectinivorans]SFS21813.1 Carboxypeptidase C (cathepsin A) [Granulicella pectinivorans]
MKISFAVRVASLCMLPFALFAQKPDAPAAKPAEATTPTPLPADAHVAQTVVVDGKTLHYTVTIGTLPVKTKDGKPAGDVVYTAYTVEAPAGTTRPVTFAMNGGPGASSVYLNFGAIGPKHVAFGSEGDSPSDPAELKDNPGTWLDFTDLVFIDPVGTGYSRSVLNEADTKKTFYSTQADIEYLSRAIFDWLVKNGRMMSRKYFVGESYGGYRGPRVTHYLQTSLGVAMNGVVLVSPYLNPNQDANADLSPVPWMMTLPSIAAAHQERQKALTKESMDAVIAYTRGDYAVALLKGRSDPSATTAMLQHVTEITGLDPVFVKRSGGRLETQAYLREVFRAEGKLGSRYDPNVTAPDPFPNDPDQRSNDPILESIIAPTTTAMVNFVTQTVGWKVDGRYEALSTEVNRNWDFDSSALRNGAVEDLREAVSADTKMRVLIVHGWNDLSCPFMGSVLTVDQMPMMGDASRVQVHEYPGGHMFYSRLASSMALRKDVMEMVGKH